MSKGKINWCDITLNPLVGCDKVNSGCTRCYAETMARRLQAMGTRGYENVVDEKGRWTGQVNFVESVLSHPALKSKKPKRIFFNSMSDLFHESVPDSQVLQVLSTINTHPQHTFLVLTKRAWKLKRFNAHYPPNLWLGCSASTQRDLVSVAKDLQDCHARIKWLSLEPLLGPLNILDVTRGDIKRQGNDEFLVPRINWIVVGCESGPKRRECRFDWVRDIAVDCSRTKIPLWIKQLQVTTKNIVVDDVDEFPIELQIRQIPEA